MNEKQRLLVTRILDWSERGMVIGGVSTHSAQTLIARGGSSYGYDEFEAAAVQLARSLIDEETNGKAEQQVAPNAAVMDALALELPAFFGPALTFMPVMEDWKRKLAAQVRVAGAWSVITLEPGDVKQARAFFDAWLQLAEGRLKVVSTEELMRIPTGSDLFVQALDDAALEFRRAYANDSLEGFIAWCRALVSPAVKAAFELAVEPRLREPVTAPAPLYTINRHLVTTHDGEVLMRKPLTFHVLTATEALQLASWLIVGAELADYDRPLETVIETVKAIRAT